MIRAERLETHNLSKIGYRVLLYLGVTIGGIIFAIPFYWMIRTAVMPPWQVNLFPPQWIPAEVNFINFRNPFTGPFPFDRWFLNSALVAAGSALGVVASSSIVAYSFARLRFPFRNVIFIIVLSTMMLQRLRR